MNFQIPLTETQRYVLRTTCGFNGLPHPFRQEDLMRPAMLQEKIPESEMPAWKRELQKREQALDIEQEKLEREITTFYTTHGALYDACSQGKNRGEAAIAFRDSLSQEDFLEHQRLFGENRLIFEEHEKMTHKANTIYRRHSSKLLGIIGIAACLRGADGGLDCESYHQRIIPPENLSAAQSAVVSGVFSKEISPQSRDVLGYIHSIARAPQKGQRQSSVSTVQIAMDMQLTDIQSIQESMEQLSGLLCHLYVPRDYEASAHQGTISEYHPRWFIPQARRALIQELCA